MAEFYNNTNVTTNNVTKFVLRFVTATVVLAITAYLTPGFTISGFVPLLLSALVISVLDFAIGIAGIDASPIGKGIVGFIVSAAILYFTQFFVTGFDVTVLSALVGALVYGIVDVFIPGKAM